MLFSSGEPLQASLDREWPLFLTCKEKRKEGSLPWISSLFNISRAKLSFLGDKPDSPRDFSSFQGRGCPPSGSSSAMEAGCYPKHSFQSGSQKSHACLFCIENTGSRKAWIQPLGPLHSLKKWSGCLQFKQVFGWLSWVKYFKGDTDG